MNTASRIPTRHIPARKLVLVGGYWGLVGMFLATAIYAPLVGPTLASSTDPYFIPILHIYYAAMSCVCVAFAGWIMFRKRQLMLHPHKKYGRAPKRTEHVARTYRLGPLWIGRLFAKHSSPYTRQERINHAIAGVGAAVMSVAFAVPPIIATNLGTTESLLVAGAGCFGVLALLAIVAHPKSHRLTRGFTGGWATKSQTTGGLTQ